MGDITTATRRGLVLTLYGDILLAAGALAFLVPPHLARLFVLGILASLLLGVPAGWIVWAGRREFGPDHSRSVNRAVLAFLALGASLLLAFFQVTSVFPESLQLADLRAPWFFLGLVLAADTAGIYLFLRILSGTRGKRWLQGTAALGLLATLAYFALTWNVVGGYIARNGPMAFDSAEAGSFVRDFTLDIVRPFAACLLVIRLGFWPTLWLSLLNVRDAEQEAEQAATTESYAPAPPS